MFSVYISSLREWKEKDILGVNLGTIELVKDGKEFKLDTNKNNYKMDCNGFDLVLNVDTDKEELKDIFTDCKFDLDILTMGQYGFDTKTIFISFEDSEGELSIEDIESVTLIRAGKSTVCFDLEIDQDETPKTIEYYYVSEKMLVEDEQLEYATGEKVVSIYKIINGKLVNVAELNLSNDDKEEDAIFNFLDSKKSIKLIKL